MKKTNFIKMKNGFITESGDGARRLYVKYDAIIAIKQYGEGDASWIEIIMNGDSEFRIDGCTIEQFGIDL